MSNPFVISAIATMPNGPGQTTDNLTLLANSAAKHLGKLGADQIEGWDWKINPIKIKTGGSGVSATGTARLYVVASEDGTIFDDLIDPTVNTDQSSKLVNAMLVQQILANSNGGTFAFNAFSVASRLFYVPSYVMLIVQNLTGAAFDGTAANFSASYRAGTYA